MSETIESARAHFKANPEHTEYSVTSDLQAFAMHTDAQSHARTLKDATIKRHYRDEFPELINEELAQEWEEETEEETEEDTESEDTEASETGNNEEAEAKADAPKGKKK